LNLFYCCSQSKKSNIKIDNELESIYSTKIVVPNLKVPWGLAFISENELLITERSGELIYFKDSIKKIIKGLPKIYVKGQGGLLDIELHPNYKENGWIYISYSSFNDEKKGANTAIMRFRIKNFQIIDEEIIYQANPFTKSPNHWGSRIEFDNDGYLYFSIGDRFNRDENPQNVDIDGGKIYRIHDDGKIPNDNPFIENSNSKKAIFTYGHRNPQGMVKHPNTGEIWIHEHGPKGGDEINIIKKGENYGWPRVTFGKNYNGTKITNDTTLPGLKDPLFYWVPSIAPSGMTFVTSKVYPDWKGNLLVGSLSFQYLERVVLKNEKVIKREKLLEDIGRVRNVKQGPDGYVYVAIDGKGIIKLIPK
tara:strand:- start:1441 stop:2529 length:1089 start_codon:yes stop_codon:yes gene_type:complete